MSGFFERYADRIIPEPNSGCWLWIGSVIKSGYGNLTASNSSLYAHRCAYEDANGPGSADGLVVRHRCDTPPCVNPDHLLGGTHQDNAQDKLDRGRNNPARGEGHPRAILSDAVVLQMRQAAADGVHVAEIARNFGTTHRVAYDVVHGATWAHVGGVPAQIATWTPPHPGYGEDAPRSVLSEAQVLEIRARLAVGVIGRQLAREYNVKPSTISAIKTRRIWAHI